MADRRRLAESFKKAAQMTRRSLKVAFAAICLLVGGCDMPERPTFNPDGYQPVTPVAQHDEQAPPRHTPPPDHTVIDLFARNAHPPANDDMTPEEQLRFYMA